MSHDEPLLAGFREINELMPKYAPLAAHLAQQNASELTLSFDEIENIIGEKLPGTVDRFRPFWANSRVKDGHPGRLWLDAGWRQVHLDQPNRLVTFRRVDSIQRNMPWSRDELILALDLYMRHRAAPPAKDAPEILELSDALNNLGAVLGQRASGTYRNENGVYMKLMNFRRLDPQYTVDGKKGLSRGNKDEALVWNEFAGNPVRLAEVAQFIRTNITQHTNDSDLAGPEEPGIEEAEEGRVATRVHRYRERDRRLVEAVKSQALKNHGRLFCVACNFDFSEQYGDAGAGIIDVHHTKPVHTMQPGEKTKVGDLVLLCANCHRVVHSRRKWLTIEELRSALHG